MIEKLFPQSCTSSSTSRWIPHREHHHRLLERVHLFRYGIILIAGLGRINIRESMLPSCFKPSVNNIEYSEIKLGHHQWGEFSMANVKSNLQVQGYSQVESGSMSLHPSSPCGTFVGIYDGHGGPNASEFIKNNLFEIVKRLTSEIGEMSSDVLDLSFLALDEQYINLVRNESEALPNLLYAGSSCLVGVVIGGRVYVANVGDSKAVLAQLPRPKRPVQLVREQLGRLKLKGQQAWQKKQPNPSIRPPYSPPLELRPIVKTHLDYYPYRRSMLKRHLQAILLSTDHCTNLPYVRQELIQRHPKDPWIVHYDTTNDIYRVKGILPTTRSIGDVYLKSWEFNTRPELPKKYRLSKKFEKPNILCNPALVVQELLPGDKFIIFASPGLWKYVSKEQAVDMVKNSSRKGIAKKLLKKGLKRRAWHYHTTPYRKLKKLDITERSLIHDDISVVVLFLDQELIGGGRCKHLSLKSYETGEASTSQLHTGEASTSQPHTGVASTSQPHIGEASTSQTDGARRSHPHIGETSTSQPPTAISKSKTWPGFSRRYET